MIFPKQPCLVLAVFACSLPGLILAAPTAVDDAFSVNEDTVLSVSVSGLIDTDFEPGGGGGGGPVNFDGTWDYLDRIENENGALDGYPTDGSGRNWAARDFDISSSTIGPWGTGNLPLQAGGVDGFPGAPDVLAGIGAAGNGGNLVTTYLFRNSFSLTAAQAALGSWSVDVLVDDSCVIYLNGTEVLRNRVPGGALTTATLGENNPNESLYEALGLAVPAGLLVAGTNVIAIEVHQATLGSSDVGLDVDLIAGAAGGGSTGGFNYTDDPFGTSVPNFSDGEYDATGGFNGTGGLHVRAGGGPPGNAAASGGWTQDFTLGATAQVEISLRFRLVADSGFENDEFSMALAEIDGQRLGAATNQSLAYFLGDGNGGVADDTGWQQRVFSLQLGPGQHTLDLGVYVSKSTTGSEVADVYFDDVVVGVIGGGGGNGGVLANDTGDAATLTSTLLTQASNGVVEMLSDGTFTYTPDANFFGDDSFTYRATDNTGNSSPATVVITVAPVNDAPTGLPRAYSTAEDQTLSPGSAAGVLQGADDVDSPIGQLVALLDSDVGNGSLVLNPSGAFTYSPAPNYSGSDSFTYRVSDGVAQSAPQAVTITVTPVDDPPLALADSYSIDENGQLIATVAQGGGGGDEIELVSAGSDWRYLDNGSDQGVGWIATTFNDNSWAVGAAQFGYGDGDEITVIGYGPDENNKYATTYFRKTFNVADPGAIGLVAMRLIRDDAAAVYLNGVEIARSNLAPEATYQTRADASTDNENDWRDFDVDPDLLVPGVNLLAVELHQHDPDSSDLSFDLSLTGTLNVVRGVLANDRDPEGAALSATVETLPASGSLGLSPDGTFTYTPAPNFYGIDTFRYRVSDGALSSIGTATVTVIPGPNDVPDAVADSYVVSEDQSLSVNAAAGVLANDSDADGDAFTARLVSNAKRGSLSLSPDGSFTYVPAANFFGADSFAYRAVDPLGESATTTVTISVTGVNDVPVARPDAFIVQPGQQLGGNVLANDSDADGDVLTAVLTFDESSGVVSLASDGSFTYDPGGFAGATDFFYEARDASTSSVEVQVSLIVNGQPSAVADGYAVAEDGILTVSPGLGLLANDSDPEGNRLVAIKASDVANGVLALEADGSFVYTPAPDFYGADSFAYVLSDGFQTSPPATVTISVQPVNDPPVAVDDEYRVVTNLAFSASSVEGVLGNDIDADADQLSASLLTNVSNGVLSLSPDGAFTYTPAAGFEGEDSFTYQVDDGEATATGAVTFDIGPDLDSVVINEIMYHPASENDLEEYIELANIGMNPVDLSGWRFSSGVDFTFPAVTLQPGSFLVIAADVTTFSATYGVVGDVVGGWTGALSNSGERIRLLEGSGVEVDDLSYSDEGDWAARERVSNAAGWDWNSDHDGGGQSLELRFPLISNKHGQNWGASQGAPTPGAANTLAATVSAPMILDVAHSPAVPKSNEPVRITARLLDEDGATLSASLFWRRAPRNPGAFSEVAMADLGADGDGDVGDGIYGATLPAMPDGTIVEFYVAASDGMDSRTWPASTNLGQVANAHYQVDDEVPAGHWPIYRIVMTGDEDNAWVNVNRSSNEQFHATLILDDCSGPVIRYNSSIRVRGAGSRSHNPPPMRVSVPHDSPWNDRTAMNWNTKYTHLQYIGMRLFQGSRMAAPDGKPMRLRWNGEDRMRSDDFDYGLAIHMEVLDGDFIDDKFPNDKDGNLYKKVRPDNDWAYRNGDVGDYLRDGWSKETNTDVDDWSDLDTFLGVMNNAPGAGNYVAQVESVVDLDQWMRWFGAMAILANGETNASNGADDDHSLYRGVVDPRFQFIPHDLDTILGKGDGSRLDDPQHTIFDMISRGDVLDPLVPLFSDPAVQRRYYQALRELLQGSFARDQFDELVNNSLIGWVPNAQINELKIFMNARRTYIAGLVDAELGPPPAPAVGTTSPTLAGAHGSLMISEILAVNESAFANGDTFPDYVELHNSGGAGLDLGGMTMTDDLAAPAKFTFPAGTVIAAAGRLLVFADSELAAPGIHLGFGLGGNGDAIYLMDGATVVDSVGFGLQIPDHSIGRTGAGLNTWALTQPTPGNPNIVQPLGDPSELRINEWLTQPEVVFERDFIELYNPSAEPVALGGLAISDDPVARPTRFQMPPLSFIPAAGFSLLEAVGNNASTGNARELPFKLGSDQGWLAIAGTNGVEIDEIHYLCHRLDVSQGRSPDGFSIYADYTLPTPGYSNSTDLSNESALVGGLRITELMYHPAGSGSEYVELRNVGAIPLDLAGVAFTEGIDFSFPSMTLQPGEYVLVVEALGAFEAEHGNGLSVAGTYSGKLSNGGERLRLEIVALGAGILDFDYSDSWYPSTDGDGFALEIVDESATPVSWSERQSWRAGAVAGGSPGGSGGGNPAAYDDWVIARFGAPAAGITGKLDDADGDGVLNVVEFALGTDPELGDRGAMLELSVDGGFLTLTFRRSIASLGLVRLIPQVSEDAQNWVSGAGLTVQELLGADAEFETWRVRDATPIGVGPRRFLRILVIDTGG